jgi:DNA-binding MarR family transcriptional regulator
LSINVSKDSVGALAQTLTGELFELSMALDRVGNAAASRLGINQTDLICLNLLARHGPMSPGQVASAMGLTTAAISAMAARLESGGYATREIDPKDRRRILMRASTTGTERAFSLFDDLYTAAVALGSHYSAADLRRLTEVITRYRELLTTQAKAIDAG